MQNVWHKSNGKVSFRYSNKHRPRTDSRGLIPFCEGGSPMPPDENLLQRIWLEQRLRRDHLRTLDGRAVTVLHPGIWNRESGPDFRRAMVQFDDEPALTGDIEVDVAQRGWQQHRHHIDPAYRQVILHVVWEPVPPPGSAPPTLPLRDVLDAPLPELQAHFASAADPLPPLIEPGACADPLRQLSPNQETDLIARSAMRRLAAKAAAIQARARIAGWHQALWEGLFAALGYKHNVWPMRRLAELLPKLPPASSEAGAAWLAWQARLFGLAGLLPAEIARLPSESRDYVRRLWDRWWREQAGLAPFILPAKLWRMHGLRPANQPTRRLALAAGWLAKPGWMDALDRWIAEEIPDRQLARSLADRLVGESDEESDDFWPWHWTLRSKRLPAPAPLLGLPRLTDLAMNAILPWLWSRAEAGRNRALRDAIEHRYFAWPAGEDNAVLRLVRQRLIGGGRLPLPHTAAMQQGLLQVARDYCDQTNVLCQDCGLPDLLRSLGKTDDSDRTEDATGE